MDPIVLKQREFYKQHKTLDINFRINALKTLKKAILAYEDRINEAIKMDVGKSNFETYMCEVGLALSELTYMEKHIRKFAKEKNVYTPLSQFLSRSFEKPSPYGVVLVISPWNYPFLLSIDPLIDALAAGNTVVLKPSEFSPYTSQVIKDMIEEYFDPEYVACVLGDSEVSSKLLDSKFDYIFYTGSKRVGKIVMNKASQYLTPVTLELGGKSPCIVDKDADIKLAARRIVFGKYLNCGQTCVAPDYMLVHESIKDQFIECVISEIKRQYASLDDYGHIINEKHYKRILGLIDMDKVGYGGNHHNLQIEPTVLDRVDFSDPIMQEEIFGPVMPILTYSNLDVVINKINSMPSPLALYIFTNNKQVSKKVTSEVSFGGGCINDVVIHLATSNMGFGGVGESGMGSYHGKRGFDTFSHTKSIVDKKRIIDLPMRYQPYTKLNEKLIRFFLR